MPDKDDIGKSAYLLQFPPTLATKPKPYFSELRAISGLCESCANAVCPPQHYGCCHCAKGHWRDEDWTLNRVIDECADYDGDQSHAMRTWW